MMSAPEVAAATGSSSAPRATQPESPLQQFLFGVALFAAAGVGYWLAARMGLAFVPKSGPVTPVWPPNGLIVGLLLVLPLRRWPTIFGGAAVACTLANLAADRLPLASGAFAVVNCLEILTIAGFLRFQQRAAYDFSTLGQVVMFTVATILGGGLMAIPGGLIGSVLLEGDFIVEWQKWFTGDVVGMLLVAPLVASIYHLYRAHRSFDADRVMETMGLLLLHVLVCFLIFFVGPVMQRESLLDATVYPYLSMLTLLLAAARLGPGGSAAASAISAGMALWAQYPPIAATLIAPSESAVMSVQLFLTLTSTAGLYIGAQRMEHLAASTALAASEQRFRTLATRAPVGIFLSAPTGETTFVNEACTALTGLDGEFLLGNAAARLVHPPDRRRVLDAWGNMVATTQDFREEYRFRHPDGKARWVIGRATPLLHEDGSVECFVGTLTDITPQKDAEARLAESEMRFRQLADASPAMIWTSDTEGRCDYLNRAWLDFRGRSFEEELGWGAEEGIHPEDIAQYWEVLRASAETEAPFSVEYRFQRADGEYRHILNHGAPRYATDHTFIGYVGTAIDISPLREAEDERHQMRERVQEAARLDSIVVLAGGVAHEFNNMLTAILGNASLAELEPGLSADAQSYLARIQDTALRAADLTRKLLAYSGRTTPVKRLIPLSQVVEETVPLLRTSLPSLVQIDLHLDEDGARVWADRAQLQQVIVNLFSNAVEALENRGGLVRITTGMRDCTTEMLASLGTGIEMALGPHAFLQVADNGVGIGEDIRERIFDPFFSTHFAGRGLGLAAVQGIVRGHDGVLHVASSPGEGSAFTIYFPAPPNDPETPSATA